ncbi:MAG TPA: transcription-repair coupling factor [Bacteroidetes bacterium]|nr:transcription-repair coupling factor [Bacteroidota bacterium]
MYKLVEEKLYRSEPFQKVSKLLQEKKAVTISGLAGSALAFLATYLYKNGFENVAVISADNSGAEKIWSDIANLIARDDVFFFPLNQETHGYIKRMQTEIVGQQLKTLEKLIEKQSGVFVSPVTALAEKVHDINFIRTRRIKIANSEEAGIEDIVNRLIDFDYEHTELVSGAGEFCVRGGLIDVFPFESLSPVRIEFFGDFVESMRTFDVISQRSQEKIEQISILPPILKNAKNNIPNNSILDILPQNTVFILDEPERFERAFAENVSFKASNYEIDEDILTKQEIPGGLQEIFRTIKKLRHVEHRKLGETQHVDISFKMTGHEDFRGSIPYLRQKIEKFRKKIKTDNAKIFIMVEEKYEVERLQELITEDNDHHVNISSGILYEGFSFPAANMMVITEKDMYGRIPRKRNFGKYRGGVPITRLNALKFGDLMVHVDHGIGRYLGLKKISVAGAERECLKLQYRDGDLLYVNIDQIQRVNRYKGAEGIVPHLNRLGGKDWNRLKEKTRKSIEKMTKDLLELYAIRKAKKGNSFSPDQTWQKELEASFIYDETPDQLRTIDEVKQDMESDSVMDRLVCGDVGFGKTEVALRAAFKSVLDGKQVAILAPTTVLAQQHYETFMERLANYATEVELLSRFRTPKQQKEIVEKLKQGKIDIIIGTHRLLSKDVEFKDLGLLVVDEEHRFGVRQKEKIKNIFKLVDVLSLTATPIPRTLHMALLGSRDMSTINTPPKDRLPVISEVVPFNKDLIRQAILDEINRGGQVFVVHNRVRSIESMAKMIQRLIPDLKIAVAHGQMKGHELEKIMLDFVRKKHQCLVSTMIIESGLDMPNVNTLIVNRADKLGLAQLYQLKGRVGRSNRQAFAYFLAPAFKFLTGTALKRLQTIEEHLELGSGLQIAMKDLEIRGAGNLLGGQQSGFINAIGFDLYSKLLNETVAKMKGNIPRQATEKVFLDVMVDAEFDAYIPEDYVRMDYERVNIYQRLTFVTNEDELFELEEELRDRFGVLPKPARVLLEITRLKILSSQLGIEKLRINKNDLTAYFSDTYYQNNNQELLQKIMRSIQESSPEKLRFLQGEKFGFKLRLQQIDETSLHFTRKFFNQLLQRAA